MRTEKRQEKRFDLIRPVLYLCQDAKHFFNGTVVNQSNGGLCIQTAIFIEPGARIYIISRNELRSALYYKTGETFFARAAWCEMREGAYRTGIKWIGSVNLSELESQKRLVLTYRDYNAGTICKY